MRTRLLSSQRAPLHPCPCASAGGPLYEAREVLQAGVEVAERFRCESMRAARGASDEHLRWITASRSQPSDAAATLVESELLTPGHWGKDTHAH